MGPYAIPKSAKNAINDPLLLGKMNLLTWAGSLLSLASSRPAAFQGPTVDVCV